MFEELPMPKKPRSWARFLLASAVLLGLSLAGWSWFKSKDQTSDALSYRTGAVDRGTVRVAIAATGSLRARSTVEIGSQISGQIVEVLVDYNQRVARDQVLARLDPATSEARLTVAQADLRSARAQLEEATVNWRNSEADAQRKMQLAERKLIARADLDTAISQRDAAQARIASARATVAQREASLANAQLDLQRVVIRSPVDGVVLMRQAEPGQTVAASFQTPVLFRIAEDLAQMQIDLAVDESNVGQIKPGMLVRFTVDTFRERRFIGTVEQVRLAASNNQNVITYPVVVGVDNADLRLLPGMTASAEIEVNVRENVLRVPNAALRFKPPSSAIPATPSGIGGNSLISDITLTSEQRAAFEADKKQLDQQSANERSQLSAQGLLPAGQSGAQTMVIRMDGGGGQPSAQSIQQAISKRMLEAYAGFRATLNDAQRAQFDAKLSNISTQAGNSAGRASNAQIWQERAGALHTERVRTGAADSTYTELLSDTLREGDAVITGINRE